MKIDTETACQMYILHEVMIDAKVGVSLSSVVVESCLLGYDSVVLGMCFLAILGNVGPL